MSTLTAHQVLSALSRRIGQENGATGKVLVQDIFGAVAAPERVYNLHTAERQLRDVVEQLRLEGHHVCATPEHGYFLAATAEELDATCLFLHERAMTTLRQIAAMKRISLPDLRGQLHLPT